MNSKGETKFNKLKTQAKAKIASLQEELDKLRAEQSMSLTNTTQEVSVMKYIYIILY